MRRLIRAAECYIWSEVIVKVAGAVALVIVIAAAWAALVMAGKLI